MMMVIVIITTTTTTIIALIMRAIKTLLLTIWLKKTSGGCEQKTQPAASFCFYALTDLFTGGKEEKPNPPARCYY